YIPLLAVLALLALCAFVLDAFEITFVVVPVAIPPLLVLVPNATWVAVLTLLILQLSFLLPPFGYALLMLRNRIAGKIHAGRFFKALAPYLLALLAVLATVVAKPDLLWLDPATVASSAPAKPSMTDEEMNEMLRRQTEPEPE